MGIRFKYLIWACGVVPFAAGVALAEEGAPAECGEITFGGTCEDQSVVWCEDGGLYEQDCAALEMVCEWSAEDRAYYCVEPLTDDTDCGDVTNEGGCETGVVTWCSDQGVVSVDCIAHEYDGCGWSDTANVFDCIAEEPAATQPQQPLSPSVRNGVSETTGAEPSGASVPCGAAGGVPVAGLYLVGILMMALWRRRREKRTHG